MGHEARGEEVAGEARCAASGVEIVRAKPAAAKGRYIRSCTLTTTMGPGIRVDAAKAADREPV